MPVVSAIESLSASLGSFPFGGTKAPAVLICWPTPIIRAFSGRQAQMEFSRGTAANDVSSEFFGMPGHSALYNERSEDIMALEYGSVDPDLEALNNEARRKRTAPGVEKPGPS